jgi:hypothetical protein
VAVILTPGNGVMVPPLPNRSESSGGSKPSVMSAWFSPAGAYSGTLCFFDNVTAS